MRILDTDTCVELLRGNTKVIERRASLVDFVATTWITASELYFGAFRSLAPENNRQLVTDLLSTMEVFGLDRPAAQLFGQTKAALQKKGEMLADADLFIAAIALTRRATLVTGNQRHYERISGMEIEDWIRG